ncbi:methylenetetrahydrofolate reductase [Kineococcus rhizosphaerae]|uniref:Methylenetetrahydrofolate reductase n=1 Tax=Kineococcus rhizosphaerae TaxID=559628 RepID=A0A2T0R4A6_9ACTN|nr:methylenetetrahydrofolate reductase [Kineococcus rhizosphaerae]PRY15132.1 5,10-methylenetetrahydrofolate reductase (NAD(P)) [Kineococcus rhizosphaerae]
MSLVADLRTARRRFSVEFSPAHDEATAARQWRAVERLAPLGPLFASVTYGAGGGDRDGTVELAGRLARETPLRPVAHLTAVGQPAVALGRVVDDLLARGVRDVLALRGDPDGDPRAPWTPHPEGFQHADQLVRLALEHGVDSAGVAAFPLGHHESPDLETDLRHLLGKVRAGAGWAVAQLTYDVEDFLRLRDRLVAAGCDVPLVPGLLPVTSPRVLEVTRRLTDGHEPSWLHRRLAPLLDDRGAFREEGVRVAVEDGRRLLAEGVEVLHLYSLNAASNVETLVRELGLAAPSAPAPTSQGTAEEGSCRTPVVP